MTRAQFQNKVTDLDLVTLLKKGDMSAMSELYQRYFSTVQRKCIAFTKDEEEAFDFAQEIMIRVMEKIASFRGASSFSTWLYALTFNYCIDQQRKKKKTCSCSISNAMSIGYETYFEIPGESEDEMLDSKIQVLSKIENEDIELLVLKYQYNKTIREIQGIYNLSASAVKMRLLRAKNKVTRIHTGQLIPAA